MSARRMGWLVAFCALLGVCTASVARAGDGEIDTEQPAALLMYPYVTIDTAAGGDTLLQLSNADNHPVDVRCFYVDGNDLGARPIEFVVRLTSRQPIAWRASEGLVALPLSTQPGAGGENNSGFIPPVARDPFTGSLRCLAVDASGTPVERNALIGQATAEHYRSAPTPALDAATYRAIGLQALAGRNDGDDVLVLGGPDAEYDACPMATVLPHFADGATLAATDFADASEVFTTIVLIPCQQDLANLVPQRVMVQFLQYNEFEQRLGTSVPVDAQLVDTLSHLDGASPGRSIFDVRVQGTLTGETLIRPITGYGSVLAVALEVHRDLLSGRTTTTAFTAPYTGVRDVGDRLLLPSTANATPTPQNTPPVTPTSSASPTRTPSPTSTASPSPTPSNTPTASPTVTFTAVPSSTPTASPASSSSGGCEIAPAPRPALPILVLLLLPALLLPVRARNSRGDLCRAPVTCYESQSLRRLKETMMQTILCAAMLVLTLAAGTARAEGKNPMVLVSTSMGDIKIELNESKAPITVKNFLAYVNDKFYDGTIFHRVIPDFMIQGGGFDKDMTQKATKPPIKNEAGNGLKNDVGTIAMARTGVVDSATAQFFINVKANDFLNHRDETPAGFGYAVFGKVVDGMDVVHKIEHVQTTAKMGNQNVPVELVLIKSITVVK